MKMMDRFMQDTYVIPPSEWDPTIRIEPPPKYTSKVKRKRQESCRRFLFQEERQAPEEKVGPAEEIDLTPHEDPNLVASKR